MARSGNLACPAPVHPLTALFATRIQSGAYVAPNAIKQKHAREMVSLKVLKDKGIHL